MHYVIFLELTLAFAILWLTQTVVPEYRCSLLFDVVVVRYRVSHLSEVAA